MIPHNFHASQIEAFPGAAAVSTEKDLYGSRIPFLLNDQAPLYLKYLQSFQLKRIYKDQHASTESNAGNLKGEDLSRALDPMSVFSTSDVLLPKGQLTSIGFMQHITLGSLLRTQYQQLLERVVSNDQLYVRSTNYRRTIQVRSRQCIPLQMQRIAVS